MFMKNKQFKDRELETFFSIQHIIKQLSYLGLFERKTNLENNVEFWTKFVGKPFEKMQIFLPY